MAVIHHALRWQMSDSACATAASVAALARAGDSTALAALAALGERLRPTAQSSPALAAFDLGDSDYLRGWLSPEAVHPALVTLLAWAPGFVPLDDEAAYLLAGLHREGGSPARPLAPTGRHFRSLERRLESVFGRSALGGRPCPGQLGYWARPGLLERRLRRDGKEAAADRIAALAGPDPGRAWLISTTIW